MLAKLLAAKHKNICVVGDASQSIYSWRGADFRNLVNFNTDYPNLKIFHLEENYRSTQTILDSAHGVISKTPRIRFSRFGQKTAGENQYFSIKRRMNRTKRLLLPKKLWGLREKRMEYSEFAVLFRTNAQSRVIEEVFLHLGLPYILVGGIRFYERKEIKDVLAMLKLLINQKDTIALRRMEKIGKTRLKKLTEAIPKVNYEKFTTIELMDYVVEKIGYLKMFDEKNEEDLSRLENIKELRSVASEFPALSQFLENVALVEQEYYPDKIKTENDNKNAVTLMTLHAAKGLEFTVVFMVGMEEGIFPHTRSLMDRSEMEEERRLCYVGITRAKKRLYLTYASRRLLFGLRSQNIISRFVFDIPEGLLQAVSNE